MIPSDIRRAARRKLAEQRARLEPKREIAIGHIVKVQSYPDSDGSQIARLAVVVAVNEEDQTIRILLAASATEFATDLDLVVPPEASGLPHDLLVQGELYGTIFEEQVVANVATLDPALAVAAAAAVASDGESLETHETGWPLGSVGDPRRTFKELELDELDAVVREWRRATDGLAADQRILDVSLLVPPPVGTDPDVAGELFVELLDVVDELGPGEIELPREWLDDEILLDELHRWQSEFGLPVARILDRYTLAAGDSDAPSGGEPSVSVSAEPRDRADRVVQRVLDRNGAAGSVVVDIYTTRAEWCRRHDKMFIRERVRSGAFVRAFARMREEATAA
ncbi:hypothetical protein [Mycobacterium sp. RTGN5]|uniref:hypothetical protein n=1 Tax=Mycobacterium sp. RTGN5 TaxID=3016522 RepID=UPI0029C93333|nr:hypothetical protein [Mycobacterium sp. RTGN5]